MPYASAPPFIVDKKLGASLLFWNLERAMRVELMNHGFAIRSLSHLATRAPVCELEREEGFELSNRVWKTRMFPIYITPA